MKSITIVALAATLAGCAIHQNVRPVAQLTDRQVCIIQNPAVKAGFAASYRRSLEAKGYSVRELPPSGSLRDCPITSTYNAHWKWDLALYMSYAEIRVYNDGRPAGEAVYDAQRGAGNMNKFIDADRKVGELVNQLFPGGAGV